MAVGRQGKATEFTGPFFKPLYALLRREVPQFYAATHVIWCQLIIVFKLGRPEIHDCKKLAAGREYCLPKPRKSTFIRKGTGSGMGSSPVSQYTNGVQVLACGLGDRSIGHAIMCEPLRYFIAISYGNTTVAALGRFCECLAINAYCRCV